MTKSLLDGGRDSDDDDVDEDGTIMPKHQRQL